MSGEQSPQSGSQQSARVVATPAQSPGGAAPALASSRPWRLTYPEEGKRDPYIRILNACGDHVWSVAHYASDERGLANLKLIVGAVNGCHAMACAEKSMSARGDSQTAGDFEAVLDFAERNGLRLGKGTA